MGKLIIQLCVLCNWFCVIPRQLSDIDRDLVYANLFIHNPFVLKLEHQCFSSVSRSQV